MNNLADQVDILVRKHPSSGISQVDSSLDAITKPKLLCQPDRRISQNEPAVLIVQLLHNLTTVMLLHLSLHPFHNGRSPNIDALCPLLCRLFFLTCRHRRGQFSK